MTEPKPDEHFFTELEPDRTRRFLFQVSQAERDFLGEEAKKRGVRVTTLIRECLRKGLFAPEELATTEGT